MKHLNEIKTWKRFFLWTLLSLLAGALAGSAASVFLISLNFVTNQRLLHPEFLWLLPLAGFIIGWTFHHYGKHVQEGTHLILEEIHQPKKIVPLAMVPWIFLGTLLTHFVGGSAGREGTVVQMGATFADQLSRFFDVSSEERKYLLMAGIGAGFGAALGTPWAGMIFGMEVIHIGRLRPMAWHQCLIASWCAYATSKLLQAPHSSFLEITNISWQISIFWKILLAGILFGLSARFFIKTTHLIEKLQQRLFRYPPLRPLFAGVLLLLLFRNAEFLPYAGLGIGSIQQSFQEVMELKQSFLKIFFTALTVGSGFKGGEFIPLVFIGSHLGSYLSAVFSLPLAFLAGLGFASVFAAASKTPWACTLMAAELFGWKILPFAALACFCSYYFSGPDSIYKTQRWRPQGRPFFTKHRK